MRAGGFEGTLAALGGNVDEKLDLATDPDPFTVLAITDAGLDGATVTLSEIVGNGAFGGLSVDELLALDTFTTFDGSSTYTVEGTDAESLTIGGASATLIGGQASTTYELDAVPEAN